MVMKGFIFGWVFIFITVFIYAAFGVFATLASFILTVPIFEKQITES